MKLFHLHSRTILENNFYFDHDNYWIYDAENQTVRLARLTTGGDYIDHVTDINGPTFAISFSQEGLDYDRTNIEKILYIALNVIAEAMIQFPPGSYHQIVINQLDDQEVSEAVKSIIKAGWIRPDNSFIIPREDHFVLGNGTKVPRNIHYEAIGTLLRYNNMTSKSQLEKWHDTIRDIPWIASHIGKVSLDNLPDINRTLKSKHVTLLTINQAESMAKTMWAQGANQRWPAFEGAIEHLWRRDRFTMSFGDLGLLLGIVKHYYRYFPEWETGLKLVNAINARFESDE